jgi:hypothetical protein
MSLLCRIHDMALEGACRAKKGTRKYFCMDVPVASSNDLQETNNYHIRYISNLCHIIKNGKDFIKTCHFVGNKIINNFEILLSI